MKKLVFLLFLAIPSPAQEKTEPAPEKKTQEAPPEKNMMPWMWANFLILSGTIYYLSKKYGSPYFAARSEGIRKDIVSAETTKREADAKIAEVDAKLANLDHELEALRAQNRTDQAREKERLESRFQAELARVHQQAEREIQSASKSARLELQRQAATLALRLAEKKVAARMNPAAQNELASEFVESLS